MRVLDVAVVMALAAGGLSPAEAEEPAPPSLVLVRTLPLAGVNGRIDHLALDAKSARLFVAALGNGTVEALSLEAGTRAAMIPALEEPQGIAFLPDLDRLVVACGGDGTVRFYDGKTLKETGRVSLGDDADNVRYDAPAGRVYVGYGDGGIAAIDARSPRVVSTIPVGAHPEAFHLESGGARLFVNAARTGKVAVVDRRAGRVQATWALGGASANFPMAVDESAKRVLVGCRSPASLVVLSSEDGKVLSTTPIAADPDDVFLDAARGRVLVVCGAGSVDVLEADGPNRLRLRSRVPTRLGARTGLWDAATDRLYVAVPREGSNAAEVRVFQPR